jgi:hypothetical protein
MFAVFNNVFNILDSRSIANRIPRVYDLPLRILGNDLGEYIVDAASSNPLPSMSL